MTIVQRIPGGILNGNFLKIPAAVIPKFWQDLKELVDTEHSVSPFVWLFSAGVGWGKQDSSRESWEGRRGGMRRTRQGVQEGLNIHVWLGKKSPEERGEGDAAKGSSPE